VCELLLYFILQIFLQLHFSCDEILQNFEDSTSNNNEIMIMSNQVNALLNKSDDI